MYRPHYIDRFAAALDAEGRLQGWRHTIAGASVLARFAPEAVPENGLDGDAVEVAMHPIYAMPNLRVNYVPVPPGHCTSHGGAALARCVAPTCWKASSTRWPAASSRTRSTTAWPCSATIPVPGRSASGGGKGRLGRTARGRARSRRGRAGGVRQLSRHRGRAAGQRGQGHQAQATGGRHRLRAGDEPGIGQVADRGGTLFGLSAALFNEITVREGRVEQTNFTTTGSCASVMRRQ